MAYRLAVSISENVDKTLAVDNVHTTRGTSA